MINQELDRLQGNTRYFDSQNFSKEKECTLAFNPKAFSRSDIPIGIDMSREDGFVSYDDEVTQHWMTDEAGNIMTTECNSAGNFYIMVTE